MELSGGRISQTQQTFPIFLWLLPSSLLSSLQSLSGAPRSTEVFSPDLCKTLFYWGTWMPCWGWCQVALSGKAGAPCPPPSASVVPASRSDDGSSAAHARTCLASPFWICLKLLLLQVGTCWSFLSPHRLRPLTPQRAPRCPPSRASRATSITDTGLSARPRAPLKGPNPERISPGGSLVMLLCPQFVRFSVSSINQGLPLFSHTRERGRHAGNSWNRREGRTWPAGIAHPVFIPLFF